MQGGPKRLALARARREAVFGDPARALRIAFGASTSALITKDLIRHFPDVEERLGLYREIVLEHARPTRTADDTLVSIFARLAPQHARGLMRPWQFGALVLGSGAVLVLLRHLPLR